ncbi:MAG: TRAP transporter substrate-binding protein, partial [Clostridiales bacterium]|nr:TRAP transporter substrate-binding protein [Clostridiales bacterium]
MKKALSLALVASLTALSLAACGSSSTASTTAAATQAAAEKPADSASEAAPAAEDPVVHITFAHADAPDGSLNGEGSKMFKQLVEEKSGGSIIVDIYPSAQLGSVSEVIAAVQNNSVDMTNISTSVLSNFCPEVGVFDMPFLFEDYDHVWEAEDGELGEKLAEKLVTVNINPVFWNGFGFRNVTTSKERVLNSIDDFKGLR